MSSAALQPAPVQSPAVGPHSPGATTSANRPYTAGSTQSRDPYYSQTSANASPSSSRRPSRRPSANGSNATPQYYSPGQPAAPSPPPTSARGSNASNPVSPVASPTNGHTSMAPGNHRSGVPPVVSSRSSSNARPSHSTSTSTGADRGTSRRSAYPEERQPTSPRAIDARRDLNGVPVADVDRIAKDIALATAGAASRSRRRPQDTEKALPQRPADSREQQYSKSRNAPPPSAIPARMSSNAGTPPSGPSRQNSEVLNRVVVSKPEVDLDRERERIAESIPSAPAVQSPSHMGQVSVVPGDGSSDAVRGPRSRHDHTKKEKSNQRFGEYFLGATLGEGEFGKVKMGWKQEGGVQVRMP